MGEKKQIKKKKKKKKQTITPKDFFKNLFKKKRPIELLAGLGFSYRQSKHAVSDVGVQLG